MRSDHHLILAFMAFLNLVCPPCSLPTSHPRSQTLAVVLAIVNHADWWSWITFIFSVTFGIAGVYGAFSGGDVVLFAAFISACVLVVWYLVQFVLVLVYLSWSGIVWSILGLLLVVQSSHNTR